MPSAIDNQLGIAEEVTFGTYLAPTRFLEFTGESLALDVPRIAAAGQRPAARVLRSDHWMPGKSQAGGDLEFELGNKGFGVFFKHALGAVTTTADGLGKKHSAALGTLLGKSLSVQVGRADVGGTVQPFSYTGGKITELTLSQEVEAFCMLSVSLDCDGESTAQALASATAPAETELFGWDDLVVLVNSVAMDVKQAAVTVSNNVNTDRFFVGRAKKKEQLENAKRDITGSLTPEFESLAAYARYPAGTIVPIVYTWTAQTTYDTAKPFKVVVTMPACRFDGETPQSDAQEIIDQPLPFTVLDDGTNAPILIDYYTSDTLP